MGRNFSIASKKHQNDFDVLVIVRKRLKNGIAISFLELSTVAPKPRVQGSSPCAPAKRKTAIGGFFFCVWGFTRARRFFAQRKIIAAPHRGDVPSVLVPLPEKTSSLTRFFQ